MFKLVVALSLGFSLSKNCFAEAKGVFISSGSMELSGAASPQMALAVRFPAFKEGHLSWIPQSSFQVTSGRCDCGGFCRAGAFKLTES